MLCHRLKSVLLQILQFIDLNLEQKKKLKNFFILTLCLSWCMAGHGKRHLVVALKNLSSWTRALGEVITCVCVAIFVSLFHPSSLHNFDCLSLSQFRTSKRSPPMSGFHLTPRLLIASAPSAQILSFPLAPPPQNFDEKIKIEFLLLHSNEKLTLWTIFKLVYNIQSLIFQKII